MGTRLSISDPRPLEFFDTSALFAELLARKRLIDVCSHYSISLHELDALRDAEGFMGHLKGSMAVRLGRELFDAGLVREEVHVDVKENRKLFRMRILVVTNPSPSAG